MLQRWKREAQERRIAKEGIRLSILDALRGKIKVNLKILKYNKILHMQEKNEID